MKGILDKTTNFVKTNSVKALALASLAISTTAITTGVIPVKIAGVESQKEVMALAGHEHIWSYYSNLPYSLNQSSGNSYCSSRFNNWPWLYRINLNGGKKTWKSNVQHVWYHQGLRSCIINTNSWWY